MGRAGTSVDMESVCDVIWISSLLSLVEGLSEGFYKSLLHVSSADAGDLGSCVSSSILPALLRSISMTPLL